jgi:bifunctional UDP-N-acetylglucosamine pyrophosphorylase / glucosamine-1-phosphate N-acetyltransferase
MSELKALILAAGKGVRMKSDSPKVLFEANGLPLLWYPIRAAREAGAVEVLAVVGAGREAVQERFKDDGLTWVVQDKQLGTGHAVRCAREALAGFGGYVFILCGDAPLIRRETLAKLHEHTVKTGAAGTVLTSIVANPKGYGRIIRGEVGISRIVEEKDATPEEKAVTEINSGTYCAKWSDLNDVLDELSSNNAQGEFLLTDAVALLIKRGRTVQAMVSEDADEGLGVNSRAQLAVVSRVLRMRVLDKWMAEGVTVVDPATAFVDERATIGRDTVIKPFVVIEGPVTIGARCQIGPFTHIRGESALGDDVAIGNFVEVKESSFANASRAKHLAFVGDARVGEDVNIGAGAITANSDGMHLHVTEIGDGAHIGAGTVLVAPTRVDAGGATGAGAVVTKEKTVPAGEVWVGVPAKKLSGGKKGKASKGQR